VLQSHKQGGAQRVVVACGNLQLVGVACEYIQLVKWEELDLVLVGVVVVVAGCHLGG